jgi:FKBP-type peptidyl-prolyl cis-trans isomerase (trigger factor)
VPFQVGEGGGLPLGDARVAGLGTEASVVARLTLPPDFGNHGGKEAEARITVRKILESVLPTDEELAAHSGLGSVDELVRDVRRHADAEIARQAHQALEAQVVDTLLDTHQFDVPSEWIERESRYLTRQLGIGGQVDDGTAKAVRELAERNVRRSFMLDAIYDAEPTLRVKAEEMEAVLDREADKQSVPKTQLKRMLLKQGMMDSIVELVKSKKIMDFLISNAEISTEGAETAPQTA